MTNRQKNNDFIKSLIRKDYELFSKLRRERMAKQSRAKKSNTKYIDFLFNRSTSEVLELPESLL